MIYESVVLLRVQYLQQGRRRVPSIILVYFIDFIEQNYWVVSLHVLKCRDDVPSHCPHIGPSMSSQLGFVPNSS